MQIVVPDACLVPILQRIVNSIVGLSSIDYHLFVNNITPGNGTVFADFTEASWTGYNVINLDWTAFSFTYVTGGTGTVIASPQVFNNTSGSDQLAYGYYVTQHASSQLLWCARFDAAPVTVPDTTGYTFLPILSDLWKH